LYTGLEILDIDKSHLRRDLAADNLLVGYGKSSKYAVKIADFGLR
jgi:hypothetical protein